MYIQRTVTITSVHDFHHNILSHVTENSKANKKIINLKCFFIFFLLFFLEKDEVWLGLAAKNMKKVNGTNSVGKIHGSFLEL